MSDYDCVACGDTGRSSRGGLCKPCANAARQPLRHAVLAAVEAVFAKHPAKRGTTPDMDEVITAVEWAYEPRTTYAAGYKERGSNAVAMFAGPTLDYGEILKAVPEDDRPAYIIEFTRPLVYDGDIEHRPIAKWSRGEWKRRRSQ